MASTSGCSRQLEELKLLDTCTMGGSDESASLPAPASLADHATTSSAFLPGRSDGIIEGEKSGECRGSTEGSVEEQIEHSKVHWSLLAESDCNEVQQLRPQKMWQRLMFCCSIKEVEDVAEVSNVEEFQALQMHPTWGGFFSTFYGEDANVYDNGELVMGKKFAEGGQAELYHTQVKWWYPEKNEEDLKYGTEYVLKVFKKGTFLKHLKSQLPQGLLQFHVKDKNNFESPTPMVLPRFFCKVHRGTLLKDGRFAFLMEKEHFDLCNLIERTMKARSGEDGGPFSKEEAESIMYEVALGVEWLHNQDIVHRDLKASNVLIHEFKSGWPRWACFVADYECSIGVVGTGFFRAPEILQACKDRKLSQRPKVFSKAADVYGYGMTCYEILTGKLPFEGHHTNEYDLVLNGQRPLIPQYIEDWTCKLLSRCWESNPIARPPIGEILDVLLANSIEVKKVEDRLIEVFGQNSRNWNYIKISQ